MPTKTVKKLRLNKKTKRVLKILGIIVIITLGFFLFYRSNINDLKRMGYSEKAANNILFKFKKDYAIKMGKNKTLNAAFESDDYIEDNLDSYAKITYRDHKHLIKNINTLLKKKYNNNQISTIITHGDDKAVSEFAKRDKVRYLDEFYTLDFAKLDLYDRYVDFMGVSREDAPNSVVFVNLDLDKENYQDPVVIDTFSNDMLVTKHRALTDKFTPPALVTFDKKYTKSTDKVKGSKEAVNSAIEMMEDAYKEGLLLLVNSGYRSYKDQEELVEEYRKAYGDNYVDKYIALAGFSEHQTGLAFDFASGKKNVFATSDEYKWIMDNAYKYGFIYRFPVGGEDITGFQSEAWHYRYVGKEIATKCHEEGITFDEYWAKYLF